MKSKSRDLGIGSRGTRDSSGSANPVVFSLVDPPGPLELQIELPASMQPKTSLEAYEDAHRRMEINGGSSEPVNPDLKPKEPSPSH